MQAPKRRTLEKRKSVVIPFKGPRSQLGVGLRPLMGWVHLHYRPRLSEVTVCYAKRHTTELVSDEDLPLEAEFRFDLDRHLPYELQQKLPETAEVRELPEETIIYRSFRGGMEQVVSNGLDWLKAMEKSQRVKEGWRQRYVKLADSDDPTWELEYQLVLG